MAEVFRGGIQAIRRGQHEAAHSLLALAIGKLCASLFLHSSPAPNPSATRNQFVYILKMSSLVSVIGLSDLTRRANGVVVNEYLP